MATNTAYLGKGIALPFRTDPATGDIKGASGRENVRASVQLFFLTSMMELDLAEDYGIRRALFENYDQAMADTQANDVRRGLARYEPRITVLDVVVSRVVRGNMIGINVYTRWRIRSSGELDDLNFVFDDSEER